MWPRLKTFKCPPLPLVRNCEVIDTINTDLKQSMLCEQFTNEAVSFIKRNRDHAFFLYLPHSFIHVPWFSQESYANNSKNPNKQKGGTISEIDHSVGRIMSTLKELGLDENTLVLFVSDNGGVGSTANLPLRGGKGTYWEGGFRVPFIAHWPGMIPANKKSSVIISALDIYPTIASFAGLPASSKQVVDGMDMTKLLSADTEESPRNIFYYYWKNELSAIRYQDWKLMANGQLFNLKNDISENSDISEQHPDIVKIINEYFNEARKDLGDKRMGLSGENCRLPGRKGATLKFLIPGKGENEKSSSYWPVERIQTKN